MKKQIIAILPLLCLLFSCMDLDLESFNTGNTGGGFGGSGSGPKDLPGTRATFTIVDLVTTNTIEGDAYSVGFGFYDGPGSAMHRELVSYIEPYEYYYKLECIGTYSSKSYIPYISFDFFTTSQGKPIDSFTIGKYYGRNSVYRHGNVAYQAFHYDDPAINQQLITTIDITKVNGDRIDGTFTGNYFQTSPATGRIVTIKGEFKNVYVHKEQ